MMSAKEMVSDLGVNSETNIHIEGYDVYVENCMEFDHSTGKVHLFSFTSTSTIYDMLAIRRIRNS